MKPTIKMLTVLAASAGLSLFAAGASAPSTPAPVVSPFTGPGGAPGGPRAYETEELTPIINRALRGGRDYANGKKVFETIGCTMCHLFNGGTGGIGPDLSGVGGRFGAFEILQSILEPSEVISDLYGTKIVTTRDGRTIGGKLESATEETVTLIQAPVFDPVSMTMSWAGGARIRVPASDIASMEESPTSLMPPGLIFGSREDEVADMMAYLMSGGNPSNRMFQPLSVPAAPAAAKK